MKSLFAFYILIFVFAQVLGRGLAPSVLTAREPASVRKTSGARGNGIHVLPMNSRFPASELRADGYEVTDLRERVREDAKLEPEPRERDELFRRAGAWPFAARLDQLDRSFLFLRAQEYSESEFARAYPRVAASVRVKLQAAAKAWGR